MSEIAPVRDVVSGLQMETVKKAAGINLDVACGKLKQTGPGWVGIDKRPLDGVDIVHDLWTFPWPIESDSVNLLVMSHYLEHIPGWIFMETMAEVHRVCRHKAQVLIAGPYGLGYRWQQDPTHVKPIVESTFAYFDPTVRDGSLWRIYEPPILHMMHFSRVPAGGDADFNCCLVVCKDPEDCEYCKKGNRDAS